MDARMLLGRFSGVSRFVVSLSEKLTTNHEIDLVWLLGDAEPTQTVLPAHVRVHQTNFRRMDRSALRRLWWESTELTRVIREIRPDVYHATWNTGVPNPRLVPTVLTVHDLIPWAGEESLGGWNPAGLAHGVATRTALRRANIVASVSNCTRREIERRLTMPRSSMRTIHNGVSAAFMGDDKPTTRLAQDRERYVLYVGGHEPRKNVAGLFHAMQAYWRDHDANLFLYLTGHEGALSAGAQDALGTLPDRSRIRFLGAPDDAELAECYANAELLLTLSTAEGFGLPVAEAMAQGCPVIAANRGSLPEVVGDAGILVDPDRADEVAKAIHALRSSPGLRAHCIARGRQQVAPFNWANAAAAYFECYCQAYRSFQSNMSITARISKTCCASV